MNINKRLEVMLIESFQNCQPPIKGIPTAGKIKWRGMKLIQQGHSYWVEQRGKVISHKLNVIVNVNFV